MENSHLHGHRNTIYGHMDKNGALFSFFCSLHPNIDFYSVPEKRLLLPVDSNAAVCFFTASCNSIGSYGRLLDSQQNLCTLVLTTHPTISQKCSIVVSFGPALDAIYQLR